MLATLLLVIVDHRLPARGDASGEVLRDVLDELPYRSFAGRWTGLGVYRPFRRSAAGTTLRVRAAASEVTRDSRGESAAVRGLALLVTGEAASATRVFEETAANAPTADAWSDLAATLLAGADASGSGEAAVDALAAAGRALELDPHHAPAHFNRMLALDRLGLTQECAIEARSYLAVDGTSGWAEEARLFATPPRSLTPRKVWEAALPRLAGAAANGEQGAIDDVVRQLPQLARTWGEAVLLSEWADATIDGRRGDAANALRLATAIGASLRTISGESFLADACATVHTALAADDATRVELLAAAQRLYRDGRMAHRDNEHRRAEQLFRRAAGSFAKARSPMQWVAAYYIGSSLYFQFRIDEATAQLDSIDRTQLQRHRYEALIAQIGWERGLCELVTGSVSNAIRILSASHQSFERLGEKENAATLETLLGEALDFVDEPDAAWKHRRTALQELSLAGNEGRQLIALTTAADDRIRREQWNRAAALLDVAADIAIRLRQLELIPYVLAKRSSVRVHLGQERRAAEDLGEGLEWARKLAEPSARRRAEAELAVAQSIQARVDLASALAALDRAALYYEEAAPAYLPPVLLERARLRRRAGDREGARSDLLAGIAMLEEQRASISGLSQRATMFATGNALFNAAIALAITSNDVQSAFELSERARARAILDGMQLVSGRTSALPTLDRIQAALAPDAAIVTYITTEAQVMAIVVRRHDVAAVALGAEPAIRKLAEAFDPARGSVRAADGVTVASRLHEAIVRPLLGTLAGVTTIAWIPNDALRGVPFLALYDRPRDRFIVEDYVATEAPSAAVAIAASRRAGVPDAATALVVGATSFDRERLPALDPIAAAGIEAQSVAALRRHSTLLLGEDATRKRLLTALDGCSIFHFAGHAIPGGTPGDAALVVAANRDEPPLLDARTLAELRLPRMRLAVLTACRSATLGGGADGPQSIASAFLMAGVPTVVASPWAVEDRATAAFAERLHRSLLTQSDPAIAVRDVLRQQARDGAGWPRDPRLWAAFRAIGGTASLLETAKGDGR